MTDAAAHAVSELSVPADCIQFRNPTTRASEWPGPWKASLDVLELTLRFFDRTLYR
jgi:hypothetical protein